MKVISAEFVTSIAAGTAGGGSVHLPPFGRQLSAALKGHDGAQLALVGRSNVGKSTLINALGRRKIARTSAAPGKTRLANFYRFALNGAPGRRTLYLVDLPGYGYARGGADAAAELRGVAEAYFAARSSRFAVRGPEERRWPERGGGGKRGGAAPPSENEGGWGPASAKESGRSVQTTPSVAVAALLVVDARHPGLEPDMAAARWLESIGVEYRLVATKTDKLSRSERARNLKTLEVSFGSPPVAVSAASGEGLDVLWKTIASLVRIDRA